MRKQFPPIPINPIRAGEIDGRAINLTADLGAVGDLIPSLDTVFLFIVRRDGFPMTSNDLTIAGSAWPNTLDANGLQLTIGLAPPTASAGIGYLITLMVNKTMQQRLFIRDLTIDVLALMG
jgi:hypothetical protein